VVDFMLDMGLWTSKTVSHNASEHALSRQKNPIFLEGGIASQVPLALAPLWASIPKPSYVPRMQLNS